MKLFSILSLGLALSLFAAGNARAFSSAESGDVNQGFVDAETRSVKKATADGYSDAISKGMALFFEDGSGGVTGLMLWRFVGGLAIGAASVIAPAYIAEIAPAHLRGRLGSLWSSSM